MLFLRRRSYSTAVLMLLITVLSFGSVQAQTLLDDFNNSGTWTGSGGTYLGTLWRQYDNTRFNGRTTFGNPATAGTEGSTNFIRLRADSTGGTGNRLFFGAEMNTIAYYQPQVGRYIDWQARVRFLSADGSSLSGVVSAFWAYQDADVPNTNIRESDEIDAEFVGKLPENKTQHELHTTTFNDWEVYNSGPDNGKPVVHQDNWYNDLVHFNTQRQPYPSGLTFANWFWVRIRWHRQPNVTLTINGTPTSVPVYQVTWFLSPNTSTTPPAESAYTRVHSTTDAVPDEQMQLKLNIWVPDSSWGEAYDSTLAAGTTPLKSFYFDVDKVYADTVTPADATPPTVTLNASPVHTWSYASVTSISGTASDASGIAEVRCQLMRLQNAAGQSVREWWDGSGWPGKPVGLLATGTSNWTWSLPANLPDGRYGFFAIARDGAGNLSPLQTAYTGTSSTSQFRNATQFYFEIDTTPPAVAITQPASGGVYPSLAQATGTVSDRVGLPSNGVQVRLQRSSDSLFWNGSSWVGGPVDLTAAGTFVPNTSSSWSYALPSLAQGSYTFSIQASDWRGNLSAWTSRAFTITALSITVSTPQSGGSYWPSTLRQATGSTTGSVQTVHGILQRISDGQYWNGTGWQATWAQPLASGTANWTWNFPPASMLTTGQYYFYARAYDAAGNEVLTREHYITINNTTTFTVDKPLAGQTYWPSQIEFASGTITGDIIRINTTLQRISDGLFWNGSGWVVGEYKFIDATAFAGTQPWSWRMPRTQMAPGLYRFVMQPQDTAGNAPLIERDFNYNPAPTLVVNRPLKDNFYLSNQLPSATGTISGEIWRMNYQLQRSDNGWCWNSTTGAWVAGGFTNVVDINPNWVGTKNWEWGFPTLAPGGYWFFVQPQDTSGRAPYAHHFFTVTSGTGAAASPEDGDTLAGEPIDGEPVGDPADSLSPVVLSQGAAARDGDKDGGEVLVTLKFTGPLDAQWAQASPSLWMVNDGAVVPLEVLCTGDTVILRLPGAALPPDEPLRVWWRGALDASGRILAPGEWSTTTP